MIGERDKTLNPRQLRAIVALLEADTLEAAAEAAGVAPVTLRRWFKEPAFVAEYRAAQRRALEGAIGRLQGVASRAVAVLASNLEADSAGVQVRAATAILDRAFRGLEVLDFEERLARVEERLGLDEGLDSEDGWGGLRGG